MVIIKHFILFTRLKYPSKVLTNLTANTFEWLILSIDYLDDFVEKFNTRYKGQKLINAVTINIKPT